MDLIHQFLTRKNNGEEFEEADKFMDAMFNVIKESLKENSYSLIEASRLLWQLLVYSKNSGSKKQIEMMYFSILRNGRTYSSLHEEFLLLGEALTFLINACSTYGSDAVKGCKVDLPFPDSQSSLDRCSKPFTLHINSAKDVQDLQSLWCIVFHRVSDLFVLTSPHELILCTESARFGEVISDMCSVLGKSEASTYSIVTVCRAVQSFTTAFGESLTTPMVKLILTGMTEWLSFAVTKMCSHPLDAVTPLSGAVEASLEEVAVSVVHCTHLLLLHCRVSVSPIVMSVAKQVQQLLSQLVSTHSDVLLKAGLTTVVVPVSTAVRSGSHKPPLAHHNSSSTLSASGADDQKCSAVTIAVMFTSNLLQLLSVLLNPPSSSSPHDAMMTSCLFPGLPSLLACCVDVTSAHWACSLIGSHCRRLDAATLEFIVSLSSHGSSSAETGVVNMMGYPEDSEDLLLESRSAKKARFSEQHQSRGVERQGTSEGRGLKRKRTLGSEKLFGGSGAFIQEFVDLLDQPVEASSGDVVSAFKSAMQVLVPFEVVMHGIILSQSQNLKQAHRGRTNTAVTRFLEHFADVIKESNSEVRTAVSWLVVYCFHRICRLVASVNVSADSLWSGSVLPLALRSLMFSAVRNVRESAVTSLSSGSRKVDPTITDALISSMASSSDVSSASGSRLTCGHSLFAVYAQVVSALSVPLTPGKKVETKGGNKSSKSSSAGITAAPADSDSLFMDLMECDEVAAAPATPKKGKSKSNDGNTVEEIEEGLLAVSESSHLPAGLAQVVLILAANRLLTVFGESKIVSIAAARASKSVNSVTPAITKVEFTSCFELFSKPLLAVLVQLQSFVTDTSVPALYAAIEKVFGSFVFMLSQSFLQEIKNVTPIARHSTVLSETLLASSTSTTPQAVLQNPEECLSRIHLFLMISNWKESVNQTSYRNNADTNDSALVMTEPLSVTAVPGLVGKITGSLVEPVVAVIKAILPHLVKFATSMAVTASNTSDRTSDPEDSQMEDTQGSFFGDCDQFGIQKSSHGSTTGVAMENTATTTMTAKDHLMFVELLLQCKTIVSALIFCKGGDVSNNRDPLRRLVLELDSVSIQLMPLNILGHSARMRMSQLMTVGLIEQAHLASCQQINSYYLALSGVDEGHQVNVISEQQFRGSEAVTRVVSLLSSSFSNKKPGFLMAVTGLMRFVRLNIFSHPHMALFVLGEVLRAWMSIDMDDKHSQNIVNEELSILAERGLLSHLMIAHDVKAIESILLPVFYSDVVSNVLADYALEIIISHVDKFREDASADHYLSFVSRRLVTSLVTAPNDSAEVTAAEIISTLSRRAHGLPAQFPHASRTLVDGRPTLIYNFLTSPYVVNLIKTDLRSLLLGTFRMLLEHTASALNIDLCSGRFVGDPLMPETQLRRVLMPLIWDLGAEDPAVSQAALTVLPVFAFMLERKAWKLSETVMPNKGAMLQAEMNECLATLVSDQMLYAMANLLQNDQHTSHQNHQVRCLQCLKALVTLFRQSDNAKFLPKILVEMGIALSSTNGRVRLAAVQLCAELCNRLHKDVLCANLSSLVVILFPILESATPTVVVPLGSDDIVVHDLKCHGKLSMNMQFVAKLSHTGVNAQGFSDDVQMMCTAAHWNQLNQEWSQQTRQTAINIIKNLFLTRRSDIQKALQSVAYIPNVEELKTVCSLHAQELRALTLEQSLKLLCQMMVHDSSQVRLLALTRLHVVCREQKQALYQILSTSATALELKAAQNQENIVGFLMQELLQLSAREADAGVQEAIARCLGELGAIEPGKLQVKLSIAGGNTSSRSSGVSVGQSQTFQPWFMSHTQVDEFAFYLLEHHLVPGLRSAALADSQDKSGYAIQTLLEHLGSNTNRIAGAIMPESLRSSLANRNILEVTEAFWNTQYKMNNKNVMRCPPIYFQGLSFPRWISLWTRFLIKQSRGRLKSLFEGCRGVVRSRSELCQFMLPHLIVDILTHYDHTDDTVTVGIIQEISTVLRGTREDSNLLLKENNLNKKFQSVDPKKSAAASVGDVSTVGEHQLQYHQMCVQSVFVLLDTLTLWQSTATQNLKDITKATAAAASLPHADNRDANAYRVDVILSSIGSLFAQLPNELLCSAAQNIKAYARALRYIENYTRELHRNNRTQMQVIDRGGSIQSGINSNTTEGNRIVKSYRDGTNGELPVLSSIHLNTLMTIYAKLEDSDSLQGTQILRQIQGYKSTPWDRIAELEHSDDWLGTLLEYGLIHNSVRYSKSLDKLCGDVREITNGTVPAAVLNTRMPLLATNVTSAMTLTLHPSAVNLAGNAEGGSSSSSTEVDNCMELKEIEDLEKGRLRCLMELGHLEAVIDQTLGMTERLPSLGSALTPLGVEAAWRLARWDDLNSFLNKSDTKTQGKDAASAVRSILSEADNFQVSIGKLMLSMKQKSEGNEDTESAFQSDLRKARIQTMSSLSAASMESYNRAYPLLTRLHVLHELESGHDVLLQKPSVGVAAAQENQRLKQIEELCWDQRLSLATSCSSSQRSMLFAVRRSVLGLCSMPSLIAQNWLELSTLLRQSGKFDSARMAIRYAESSGLDPQQVLVQECHILRGMGQGNKALTLMEPVEIDAVAIIRICKSRGKKSSSSNAGYPPELDTAEKRMRLAERLHLATQLMVENQQKQGRGIIDRYNAVILLNKKWELAYFELAKYYDFLHQEAKNKEQQQSGVSGGAAGGASSSKALGVSSDEMAQLSYGYLENALSMYGNCLKVGTKMAMQILPRMLTLWLSFTSLQEENLLVRTSSLSKKESLNVVAQLKASQAKANDILTHFSTEIPPSTWFMCMPQLVSRTGHRNPDTLNIIISILQSVLCAYPKQGIWHLASMMHSFNPDRKKIARKLLQDTYKQLINSKPEDARMLVDSQKLFANLVSLAGHQCKDKKLRWKVPEDIVLDRFLVPTQAVLHVCNPLSHLNRSNISTHDTGDSSSSSSSYSHHTQNGDMMFIQSFNDVVDVAASKAKPKTITLTTVCGKSVKFLCKQEKDGDLRKDARMMEFNTVVNRLFKEDSAALSRNLGLRTFAVVCLNEECGILEWVNNTDCIRTLIDKAHKCAPDQFPNMSYKDIYHQFVEYQTKHEDNLEEMIKAYRALIEAFGYRPCFHKWFLDRFPDPTEWLEARTTFTRSVAVWSGVGHVIGLGDRHTENILIDQTNGECVHVDFDCLFDKGLGLARPEIVPFRLTPNMVDAMGLTGVEGCYRKTMEVCMTVLRANKDTLLSVLEPFLRDPTVMWSRSGRAQKGEGAGDAAAAAASRQNTNFHDHENKEATAMLLKIGERLNGVYNIQHPHRERFLKGALKRSKTNASAASSDGGGSSDLHYQVSGSGRGIGLDSREESLLPLSVVGQVQRLIDEAVAEENLVQLYIGWQPWV